MDLQEDTVIYKLFPPSPSLSSPSPSPSHIDLLQCAVFYTNLLQTQFNNYIWHYEGFHLKPLQSKDIPCLIGSTCYHGNVEDEWFIVKLLVWLTKEINGLVVSITDNDGQFLLIESAHHLPKWLKPETAENRVFVYQGQVHIIPQPRSPGEVPFLPVTTPTLLQGVALVRNSLIDTHASVNVQKSITARIEKSIIPLHCAHCYLPLPAASLLIINPQLISSIIHALVQRDKNDMKSVNKMAYFSSQRYPLVLVDLQFTRLLYAMLVSDKLTPPIQKGVGLQSPAHLLGAKIVCGLEILAARYGNETGKEGHTHQWEEFIANLKRNGYFENEIEGSLRYQSLMKTAKEYWNSSNSEEMNESVLSIAGKEVREHLIKGVWSEDDFHQRSLRPPDDDSWMNIEPEELEEMLKERGTQSKATPTQLDDVSYGVKSFVDQVSSLEGVEFPWTSSNREPVELSGDEFISTLRNMFDKMENMTEDDLESVDSLEEEDLEGEEEGGEGEEGEEGEGEGGEGEVGEGEVGEGEGVDGDDEENIHKLIQQMDHELSNTTMADSFKTISGTSGCSLKPVDVDFNLVQNILDNYKEQLGEATPTSNILSTLGLSINSSK